MSESCARERWQTWRRAAWLGLSLVGAVVLAGCPGQKACEQDSECGGEVCARTGECLPQRLVHPVQVRWTIRGAAASAQTCAPVEPLEIRFFASGEDGLRFTPLACSSGLFTVDKLPTRIDQVRIDGPLLSGARAGIPLDGQVMLDVR
jgi:hypothetical protein